MSSCSFYCLVQKSIIQIEASNITRNMGKKKQVTCRRLKLQSTKNIYRAAVNFVAIKLTLPKNLRT